MARALSCCWMIWPQDVEGSCKCIEWAVADGRQGWPSSLGAGE